MMKKLLLCSETSTEDLANDNGNVEDDGQDDGQDVVVESPSLKDSLKTLCDVDNLNIKNFNYDVIVHFVRQGKFTVYTANNEFQCSIIILSTTGTRVNFSNCFSFHLLLVGLELCCIYRRPF